MAFFKPIQVAGKVKVLIVTNPLEAGTIRLVTSDLAPHLLEQTGQKVAKLDAATLDLLTERIHL
jgi:hypothetical protein